MSDFIPYLIKSGRLVKSYIVDAFWYDVGSTEKYEKLTNELVQRYLAELEKYGNSLYYYFFKLEASLSLNEILKNK